MVQLTSPSSAFEEDIASYRPMSRIAVVAAITGVASVAALLHPLMWFIPAMAITLGVLGLFQINRAAGTVTGQWMSLSGICLGLFFASWVVSSYFLSDSLITRQSRHAADRWLQMIEQHALKHAHQWTLNYASRANPGEPLDTYYKPDGEQYAGFKRVFEAEPAKSLAEFDSGDEFSYVGCEEIIHDRLNHYVTLRYQLRYTDGKTPLNFLVVMRRFKDPETFEKSWTVQAIAPYDTDADTEP